MEENTTPTAPDTKREQIIETLQTKSALLQRIFDNTQQVFGELKEILQEYAVEVNERLEGHTDKRVKMEYRDRGKFEAQLQMASDILIFSMHTNVFMFERENIIWQNSYVKQDKQNAYCGVINIYNFLSDSFKYNRSADEGYLVARIFINRDFQYMVEGKRQVTFRHDRFGQGAITPEALTEIIENTMAYTLDFDLLVPPYDTIKIVTVDQMNTKIENSKLQTGKRLGYQFRSDDV
ncbi:MAG TPA: hypothetical protein H9888_00595 [Candidatus Rikenella faecigallinarum]|uniref:Uncharacterized protein n=1 Tax=Candidatus Rikenella faecigallinarum TaxID=2838745 RepID=A0A9D1QC94_9BACT|nr:hypothetical protein [Candidatus Rikenella faecigallinarum]